MTDFLSNWYCVSLSAKPHYFSGQCTPNHSSAHRKLSLGRWYINVILLINIHLNVRDNYLMLTLIFFTFTNWLFYFTSADYSTLYQLLFYFISADYSTLYPLIILLDISWLFHFISPDYSNLYPLIIIHNISWLFHFISADYFTLYPLIILLDISWLFHFISADYSIF